MHVNFWFTPRPCANAKSTVPVTRTALLIFSWKDVFKLSCAGKCAQVQVLPDSNTAGQQHMACKLLHSSKQAAFVLFYRVLEGGGKGAVLTPGTLEWTLVPEVKLGEEKSMLWTLPGIQGFGFQPKPDSTQTCASTNHCLVLIGLTYMANRAVSSK